MGAGKNEVIIKEPTGTTVVDRNALDNAQDSRLRRMIGSVVAK